MSEQQPYDVIETHDDFELRRYPEHLVAEISVTAPFEEAGSRAFRVVPVQVAAARRFSGRGSEGAFARHLRELESALASAGLSAVGSPRFARFDAPYVPGLLRRNEVVIEIEA
ncbi:MAG: heme-binding protein [Ornithinibacter sp.]